MSNLRYIGRVINFKGKRLFDILCRLKDFGKGRVVYRHTFFDRYPEPSYYVVTNVEPFMSDPTLKVHCHWLIGTLSALFWVETGVMQ